MEFLEGENQYVNNLSPELREKAANELKEKPEWVSRDIEALREMVKAHPGLNSCVSDAFLLRFLRSRKFDYDRALNQLLRYYKVRKEDVTMFNDFKPSKIKHVLDDGVIGVLENRDLSGRKVIIFRPGKWCPSKYPTTDCMRAMVMTLELLTMDEATQINGVIVLADLQDTTLSHVTHIGPSMAKRMSRIIEEAFPARVKAIHYVNAPYIFSVIFAVLRGFLKEKLASRLHVHTDFNSLYESEGISVEVLPVDFGGCLSQYSNSVWAEQLLNSEQYFEKLSEYSLEGDTSTLTGLESVDLDTTDPIDACIPGVYRKASSVD
ncbi:unnamed protein product [Owenia fusiformis]|uniref:Uncharacterized protein n=1 Tax=Owenia fusiformis TaxID=6347 RepID=A0A8J1U8D3_OWEFU|nr:unnamed protein product [Owenia fusiformis]